jgi:hypothetical protein
VTIAMPGRHAPERLDTLIPGVIERMSERHGALFEIQRDWSRLVGRRLAAHTRPVSLRRGVLTVQADHPGDGFSLSYRKPELLERFHGSLPGKVETIVIRPGGATPPA